MVASTLFFLASAFGWLATAIPVPMDQALSEYANDKMLIDAAGVFGIYNYSADLGAAGNTTATWMGQVPDSTELVHMNIPGTHDSATWNLTREGLLADGLPGVLADPRWYKCQARSLADMLRDGIRFFDLRYNLDPTGQRLVFWHNTALISETATLESVLFAFYRWLDAHPSEAVIISLKLEKGARAGAIGLVPPGTTPNETMIAEAKRKVEQKAQRQLLAAVTSDAAKKYILQTRDALGTLGDARGHIVLFRRFTLDASLGPGHDSQLPGIHLGPRSWKDNNAAFGIVYGGGGGLNGTVGANSTTNGTASSNGTSAGPPATVYIEDLYSPGAQGASLDIEAKFNATMEHLIKATADKRANQLFITFASGEHDFAFPPVYPEIMALGNGTVLPRGGVNNQLVPLVTDFVGKRMGIVVLDFYEQPPALMAAILARSDIAERNKKKFLRAALARL